MLSDKSIKVFITYKGYDAGYIVKAAMELGAVIPSRSCCKVERPYNVELYKKCNLIYLKFNLNNSFVIELIFSYYTFGNVSYTVVNNRA